MKKFDVENLSQMALGWLETHGPSVLVAIIIFIIGQWIIRIIKKWIHNSMERREVSQSIRPFFQSFIATILQILLLIVVLQVLSVQLTIFTAIVTSFGVAAGLALSGTLQNFTGGILILLLKPFRVGDNIIAQGQDGVVNSIEIFYTIITTQDNRTVIIPNSKVSNEVIINISRQGIRRMEVEMKFSFAIDLQQVTTIIKNTVIQCDDFKNDPPPYVGVSVLDPDGYKVMIHAWVDALRHNQLKLEFQKLLVGDLKKAGIKLPGT